MIFSSLPNAHLVSFNNLFRMHAHARYQLLVSFAVISVAHYSTHAVVNKTGNDC